MTSEEYPCGVKAGCTAENKACDICPVPKQTIPRTRAANLIEQILPSPIAQRSWSLGPQRMCQELRRLIYQLKNTKDPSP